MNPTRKHLFTAAVCSFVLTATSLIAPSASNASTNNSEVVKKQLTYLQQFVMIDGKKVTKTEAVALGKKITIKATIVTGKNNQEGKPLLFGFTTNEKAEQWLKEHPFKQSTKTQKGVPGVYQADLYEDLHGLGEKYILASDAPVGIPVLAEFGWDNRISSLTPSCMGVTTIYEGEHFSDRTLTFAPSRCAETINLNEYLLDPQKPFQGTWDNQASSVQLY
ncbi:hypothetical protein [Laceyella putida]|uniref:Uncharacterized protein n=1 Tax=Laceyella putida TaxID=110101 RepID=A0ABW2RFV9_9BACL